MQHHPERLYDAINANELGAIITEHRNLLLCSLLRPMLDTFEREGIQLSAVLRALATLAQERSRTLSAADSSNPWLQCEALLAEAQTMAEMAEQRPKVTGAGTADGNNGNAVLDYLAQTGSSQGGVASFGGLTQPDPQGEAIASDSEGLEAELEGWRGNEVRFIFIILCLTLLFTLKILAIPILVTLYVLLSISLAIFAPKS